MNILNFFLFILRLKINTLFSQHVPKIFFQAYQPLKVQQKFTMCVTWKYFLSYGNLLMFEQGVEFSTFKVYVLVVQTKPFDTDLYFFLKNFKVFFRFIATLLRLKSLSISCII